MGKLPKQLELDVLGPSFSRPSLSTYPYSNFWPMFNASSFKISLAPLTRFHQPNYPWATSNSLKLSKTSIPHKSQRPTFQPFLISPPQHLWPAGSSYRTVMEDWPLALILNQKTRMIGPTPGLIVKMAHYVDLTNKEQKLRDPRDWPNCPDNFCVLTGAYLLKAMRPPDSRPPATWPQDSTVG